MGPGISLRYRLLSVVALLGALLVVLTVASTVTVASMSEAVDARVNTIYPAAAGVGRLRAAALDQETGERGYVVTGTEGFLQPYLDGRANADREFTVLSAYAGAIPGLDEASARAQRALTTWNEQAGDPEIAEARAGRLDRATAMVESGIGRQLFDEVRVELDGVQQRVDDASRANAQRVRALQRRLQVLLVAGLSGMIMVVAILAWVLRRSVTAPTNALVRQVDAVSAGAFREPVVVSGPPEFVAIGQSVERMRQKILAELDEVERSNEALALEGPVVNALREELGASPFVPRGTVEVAGRLLAAEGVLAGDFYDVRWLADGSLAIVVADVAGHGYEAGLLALRFKILVEAALAQDSDPGRCLTWAAARLGETESMFLTCALAILDVNERRLLFASAGHPAGVLLPSDGSLAALESTGPVIGPFSGCWQNSVVELDPGEAALVLCSDGLFEARSGAGVLFGFERAADLIRSEDTAEDIVDTCCAAARDHAAVRLRDDLTIVAVRLR